MKICVSGATGFIGSALMRYLASQGAEAIALNRTDCEAASMAASATNRNALINKLSNADAVIHLAGRAHVLRNDKAAAPRLFNESNGDVTTLFLRLAGRASATLWIVAKQLGAIAAYVARTTLIALGRMSARRCGHCCAQHLFRCWASCGTLNG